jgi:paraquat-inducible protein A
MGPTDSSAGVLMACQECDALSRVSTGLAATFRCPRCHALLHRAIPDQLDNALSFSLASSVLLVIANCFPIVSIEAAGNRTEATMLGAAVALYGENKFPVALLVILTTVVAPAVELTCTIGLLVLAKWRHPLRVVRALFRTREALRPWSMVEIFVLGTLVAITRLGALAQVIVGLGLWSLIASMLMSAASTHAFDSAELWEALQFSGGRQS